MKKIIYLVVIFLLSILSFEIFSNKNFFVETIIHFLSLNKDNYSLLIIINIVYFLSPLPVTPLILANGFLLNSFGFFILYPIIIIDSLLIFLFSRYLIHLKLFNLY